MTGSARKNDSFSNGRLLNTLDTSASIGMRLILLFVVVPAIELMLLIEIGQVIGTLPTFGLILVTGLAGSALARTQGLSVWRKFQARLSAGRMPGDELIDGLIILVSGALLLTPGVLTDIVGLAGLIPLTRRLIRKPLSAFVRQRFTLYTPPGNHPISDAEWTVDDNIDSPH